MATFVAKSNTYGGRYLQLTITQVKNIADNTSTLKWVLESIGGTSNYYSISETTIKINGQQVYHKGLTPWNSYEFPAKKGSYGDSITVTHNSDGTLTVPVIFSTAVYDGYFLKDYGGSFVLDTIERTSTVSCTNADIGTAPTITINAGSSAFRHTLRYSFGSLSGTIVTKTSETQYTDWVLPESFYGELADAQTGTATIYCDTYNGNTLLGTESCTFTVTASSYTSSPTLSPTITDTNDATYALTGNRNILVRYHSTASVTINAEAKNGATIKTQTVTNGNRTLNGPTCEFTNVEYGYFSFAVTDSRGYSTNSGRDLTTAGRFVEYIKPTCTQANSKPDANGTMNLSCSGNYFNGNFGAADNTLRVQYRYKMLGGAYTDWASMGVTKNGNTYTASVAISKLDYRMTYVFETRAIDSLMSITASSKAVKSLPLFHWGENDVTFEVPVQLKGGVTGDFTFQNNLRLKGDGNYGNFIYFGDGTYASIGEPQDDVLRLKASAVQVEALSFIVNGTQLPLIGTGEWTPNLMYNSSLVDDAIYTTQKGWYQKVGKVVTVGWDIKATVWGYSGNTLKIGSLPYTPICAAFGGGVAHNVYIPNNFNFECWGVDTSGYITGRAQPCSTRTGLLEISSSVQYPNDQDSHILTLAGTICYETSY